MTTEPSRILKVKCPRCGGQLTLYPLTTTVRCCGCDFVQTGERAKVWRLEQARRRLAE